MPLQRTAPVPPAESAEDMMPGGDRLLPRSHTHPASTNPSTATITPGAVPALPRRCDNCGRPHLAATLRTERAVRSWSQKTMASRLRDAADPDTRRHLPSVEHIQRMVRSWETGHHQPSDLYAQLYCRAFGMSYADLFTVTVMEMLPGLGGPLLVINPSKTEGAAR